VIAKTAIVSDDTIDDEIPDLDDDDLEEVDEPPPTTADFMKFAKKGDVYDVLVTEFDRIGGRNFNDQTCPQVRGHALVPLRTWRGETEITVPRGQLLTLTAGQARLSRRLANPEKLPKIGHRLRVEYTGDMKDRGKTIKTFKVSVGEHPMRVPTSWTSQNGDDNPPF